jgi:hypothetical protein
LISQNVVAAVVVVVSASKLDYSGVRMHLKVQEMPVIMKIDRRFKIKEIVNRFLDVTRIWYKHKKSFMYSRKNYIYEKIQLENACI